MVRKIKPFFIVPQNFILCKEVLKLVLDRRFFYEERQSKSERKYIDSEAYCWLLPCAVGCKFTSATFIHLGTDLTDFSGVKWPHF